MVTPIWKYVCVILGKRFEQFADFDYGLMIMSNFSVYYVVMVTGCYTNTKFMVATIKFLSSDHEVERRLRCSGRVN